MDLSIVILNYQTKGLVKNCIRGIKKYPNQLKTEIIVVDNDSADGTPEMIAQEFPDVKLISSYRNLGHAAGNNLGIKAAQGKYVLLLNPDIVVIDNSIEKMVKFMEDNRTVAAAGCKLKNPDGSLQMNCRRFPEVLIPVFSRTWLGQFNSAQTALKRYLMVDDDHSCTQPVDWIFAACLMVRREAVEQVGLLDERFFLYFADVDWCRQFWQNGWQVFYYPEAEIIHYHHRESAENYGLLSLLNQKTRIHVLDWFKYLQKYGIRQATSHPNRT